MVCFIVITYSLFVCFLGEGHLLAKGLIYRCRYTYIPLSTSSPTQRLLFFSSHHFSTSMYSLHHAFPLAAVHIFAGQTYQPKETSNS